MNATVGLQPHTGSSVLCECYSTDYTGVESVVVVNATVGLHQCVGL